MEIAIAHDADGVRVVVSDDGIGMPANGTPLRGPSRFGLLGMRERVMAMAGSLSVDSGRDGKGVRLTAHLPCAALAQPDDLSALA